MPSRRSSRSSMNPRPLFARGWRRRALCLVLIGGLLVIPDAGYAVRAATDVAVKVAKDAVEPLPLAARWVKHLFRRAAAQPQRETTADRNARVQHIRLSPGRFVGYVGETITFVAMGLDADGQPAHGAKFDWSTNDTNKLQLDDAGRATLIHPGLARITCRVGAVEATARLLIRPTRRPLQTDEQWRSDQGELQADPADGVGLLTAPSALLDKLLPAAQAQLNSPGDYGGDAQTIGSPTFTPKEPTRLGAVLSTNNFELAMPVCNVGGRGLATSLNLYYNSSVWGAHLDQSTSEIVYTFDPIQSWPSPGFSLGFGRIVYYNGYTDANQIAWHSFMLIDPDGTRHALGVGQDYGNNTLQTTDGSHLTYVGNAATGGTLYYKDGTTVAIGKVNNRLLPTMITDTNGNYIQVAYKWETNFPGIAINYIVDTLGRVIQFNYGEWPAPNAALLSSINGASALVTFNYQSVTMNAFFYDSFGNQGPTQNMPSSFYAVSQVTASALPQYQFSYSGYGMIYQVTGTAGGGSGTMSFNYPLGGEGISGAPKFTQRTETGSDSPTGVYSYGANGVTRPDGSVLNLGSGGQQIKNSGGQVLSEVAATYTTDPGGSPAVQSIMTTDELGQQTKVDFAYDQYGNVVNKREYGYKISGQWQVRRRTQYTYVTIQAYLDKYIRNLMQETDVYESNPPDNNDANDTLIGRTVAGYDNYSAMGSMEGYGGTANPPGHLTTYDTSVGIRGNLTGVTTYSDVTLGTSETRYKKVDIFGNTTKAQVSCCSEKTFYCDGHTDWARPCTVTSGNPADKCLTTIHNSDFNTLNVISVTDPNNQTTSYSYDAAQRVTNTTSPTGASSTAIYNPWGVKTSSSVSYDDVGTSKTVSSTAIYDGWGQMRQSIDANGAQVNYTYDAMGRLLTQTNPFPQGTTPGPVTTYLYDLLGRVITVTLPGGNTVQTAYSGSVITVTDQVHRQIKRENDGLGRLIKVTEPDASGALAQETTYTYDAADRLTLVNQGNQTRAFKYDAEGHLLFERIPEQSATINDGTNTYWTTKYTYTDWGAVATRKDARGVVTNYTYDSLHRLTNVSYDTSQAAGAAATPAVTYTYDNSSNCDPSSHTATSGTTKGLLLSVSVGSFYWEGYGYDDKQRVAWTSRVLDGRSYVTTYNYNAANQLWGMGYPSSRWIGFGHDAKGRVSNVGSYLASVSYDGIGQMIGDSLGNGVSEGFGYDPNRMQMISQTATKSGGPTNGLMNLHYDYNAAAGQMGAGSMAGNAGQLMAINNSSTINGTAESASYTYDNVGRLATSNQTSNGQSAQRRFVHDRWGNRTEVWDAISGGWRIQYASLEQAGGAPTNRLLSLYTASGGYNYLYDAAGNVLNDGLHSYIYDAESRLVSVDSGATASYSYDQQNRRLKKTTGGVTHYVWQGSQVQAEYNGGTGALLTEYIYSGSRLLAKIEGGATSYFLSDRLSLRLTLDASGNVVGRQGHLPFGEDIGESGAQQKQHFTSYERDSETGTDYAVNRQYSQSIGRFNRPDPYACNRKLKEPQNLNRYAYSRNDSINLLDRTGLDPEPDPPDPTDANKIPAPDIGSYKCNSFFDNCKSMGEKIRDLTVDLSIRWAELDPNTDSYKGHAHVWAEHKNVLSDCVSKFIDNKCGPPDLPSGFDLEWANRMAMAPAPGTAGFQNFIDRGGLEFLAILLGGTAGVAGIGAATWFWELAPIWCPVCDSGHRDFLSGLYGLDL